MERTVEMTFERSTPNTHRFAEKVATGGSPVIGTLYIQKSAIGEQAPKRIVVTVKTP